MIDYILMGWIIVISMYPLSQSMGGFYPGVLLAAPRWHFLYHRRRALWRWQKAQSVVAHRLPRLRFGGHHLDVYFDLLQRRRLKFLEETSIIDP
jgi:hypothetical protein